MSSSSIYIPPELWNQICSYERERYRTQVEDLRHEVRQLRQENLQMRRRMRWGKYNGYLYELRTTCAEITSSIALLLGCYGFVVVINGIIRQVVMDRKRAST